MPTPLTDAINALTTYSNEVTGESDTTLSDAVHTLASGYGQGGVNYLNYVTRLANLFLSVNQMPQKIEFAPIQLTGNNNGYFIYRSYEAGHDNDATIDLHIHFGQTTTFPLKDLLIQAYGVKTLKITGNLQYCTSYFGFIDYCNQLSTLDMIFDFSSVSGDVNGGRIYTAGYDNLHITDARFVQNTARCDISIVKLAALNDDSIVSAANCLVAGVSGKTLTLHATPKARCSTLMGINDNGTFTIDENGPMTLADFITNVKGWTLA